MSRIRYRTQHSVTVNLSYSWSALSQEIRTVDTTALGLAAGELRGVLQDMISNFWREVW